MDQPMILVVNPNTSQEMTAAIARVAQAAAGPQAHVVTIRSQRGPYAIEGALDTALATAGMLEVVAAYRDPFDAVVVACFGDPGVDALRMLVQVPVIGIGAASFMQAASQPTVCYRHTGGRHAGTLCRIHSGHGIDQAICGNVPDAIIGGRFRIGGPLRTGNPGLSR